MKRWCPRPHRGRNLSLGASAFLLHCSITATPPPTHPRRSARFLGATTDILPCTDSSGSHFPRFLDMEVSNFHLIFWTALASSPACSLCSGQNEGSAHVGKGPLYPQHPLPLLTVSFLEGSAWSVSFLGAWVGRGGLRIIEFLSWQNGQRSCLQPGLPLKTEET